jgi:hypothetical protein
VRIAWHRCGSHGLRGQFHDGGHAHANDVGHERVVHAIERVA